MSWTLCFPHPISSPLLPSGIFLNYPKLFSYPVIFGMPCIDGIIETKRSWLSLRAGHSLSQPVSSMSSLFATLPNLSLPISFSQGPPDHLACPRSTLPRLWSSVHVAPSNQNRLFLPLNCIHPVRPSSSVISLKSSCLLNYTFLFLCFSLLFAHILL